MEAIEIEALEILAPASFQQSLRALRQTQAQIMSLGLQPLTPHEWAHLLMQGLALLASEEDMEWLLQAGIVTENDVTRWRLLRLAFRL